MKSSSASLMCKSWLMGTQHQALTSFDIYHEAGDALLQASPVPMQDAAQGVSQYQQLLVSG